MAYLPPIDRYDVGVLALAVALFAFSFLIYPVHLLQVLTVLVVFTVLLGWFAYLLQKWFFDAE